MSQTSTAASNSAFFTGYFNGNGSNQAPVPLMNSMNAPPPPPPPPPLDASQPPPPPPPSSSSSNMEVCYPPPVASTPNAAASKVDTSVPPPTVQYSADVYQNWAMQWAFYQQAQQAQQVAAYQSHLYQSFANQPKATPTPPVSITSNGYNPQQQSNINSQPASSKWQPTNSSPTFRPRQTQPSYRSRFSANASNQSTGSYNNVPPPASLAPSKPQTPSIRFQLNTRPTLPANRPGRKSRFSSPPKQQTNPVPFPTPTATPTDNRMDTSDSRSVLMSPIQAFKLACDKQNWPEPMKDYWQLVENRCATNLLRSQADEWWQGVLVDAFQKNLVNTIDWANKPLPGFLLRSDSSAANVRPNTFDSATSSLLQLAKSSYAENKQREDLSRLNKLRQITSESVQRAFGNNDDDEENGDSHTTPSRKRSSSSSSSSSTSTSGESEMKNNKLRSTATPVLYGNARKRARKARRAKKPNKKMQLDDSSSSKPENTERLQKRRNRFIHEQTTVTMIKPIQAPGTSSTVSENSKALVGTSHKLEKNYLRLTSEADPATIRPLSVLERAFSFVMDKYRSSKDWSYISDQLKSIRQDLMVQAIRNDFTVLVYEENARISLEMGDREQFNQCQTQLETLYESGCDRSHLNEFLIYRLLYSLLLNDYKKTTRILLDIDTVKDIAAANGKSKSKDVEHLNLALDLCTAIRRKNYTRFFVIYRSLPRLASCLVNLFIDIYRKQVLKVLIWGFAPTLPIEAITRTLSYESNDLCKKQLSSLGVILIDESLPVAAIDCKASRAVFEKK